MSKTNDEMKNLLDSTEISTIFLDTDLRVCRFTPEATEMIPLTATDSGRPIKYLASTLIDTDLAEYGQKVLRDLAAQEAEVKSEDDRCYLMRVRPYHTVANVIDGVVITFEYFTERKQAEQALSESGQRYYMHFEMATDSIVLVDEETGTIAEFNRRAHEHLGYTIFQMGSRNWGYPTSMPRNLQTMLQSISKKSSNKGATSLRSNNGPRTARSAACR